MPTFENPAVHADDAQAALRALAHATRSIEDPRQIYAVLGSLTSALASLSQTLHQLAALHDGPAKDRAWVADDAPAGRAAKHQVSWELHRAGEMIGQVSTVVANAHNAEASMTYARRDLPSLTDHLRAGAERGLSL